MIEFNSIEITKIKWVENTLLPFFQKYENLYSINLYKKQSIKEKQDCCNISINFVFKYKNEKYVWTEEGVYELNKKSNSLNNLVFNQLVYLNKINVDFYIIKNKNKLYFEDLKKEILCNLIKDCFINPSYIFERNKIQEDISIFYGFELNKKIVTQYLNLYLCNNKANKKQILKI